MSVVPHMLEYMFGEGNYFYSYIGLNKILFEFKNMSNT